MLCRYPVTLRAIRRIFRTRAPALNASHFQPKTALWNRQTTAMRVLMRVLKRTGDSIKSQQGVFLGLTFR
jgi:hypothetical protein